jgi:hypothetical protein
MREPIEAKNNQYQSYLLRMWRNSDGNWRALLVSIPTQERRHFASLPELFNFLNEQQVSPVMVEPGCTYSAHTTANLSVSSAT